MNGPQRLQIQRQYTGPAATVGAPPVGYEAGTGDPGQTYGPRGESGRSSSYEANLAAKQARDAETVARKPKRPRSAGPMKPRSRGDAIRNGNGNGGFNGGGYSPPAVNGAGAPAGAAEFWKNPYYLAAVAVAVFWWMRRDKK